MQLNNQLIDFTQSIFDKLNNNKTEYCFLRNYQKLWGETGFDIDLLINKTQKTYIQNIIKIMALEYGLFFSSISKKQSMKILVCDYDINNNKKNWLYFDIQISINCFNKFKFYFNDITIDDYSINNLRVPILSENWQFFFLLNKFFKKDINDIDLIKLKSMYNHCSGSYEILQKNLGPNVSKKINTLLTEDHDNSDLILIKKDLFARSIIDELNLINNIRQKIIQLLVSLNFNVLNPYKKIVSPVIVISGPDGVGKTTIINELSNRLLSYPINFKTAHHMDWKKNIKIKRAKLSSKHRGNFSLKGFIKLFIPRPINYILNLLRGEYDYIKSLRKIFYNAYYQSELCIMDRYIIDRYAKKIAIGHNDISTKITKIVMKFISRPILSISLIDEPKEIIKRKQELNKKEISIYQDILINGNSGKTVKVNGRLPNEIAVEINQIIFNLIPNKRLFSLIGSFEKRLKKNKKVNF